MTDKNLYRVKVILVFILALCFIWLPFVLGVRAAFSNKYLNVVQEYDTYFGILQYLTLSAKEGSGCD